MQKLVVLGAGESGVGTAILGKKQGYSVFVSDKGAIHQSYKNALLNHQIEFEENQHTESVILKADLVMKSPGIPDKVEIVQKLIQKGIKVISEIEFASWFSCAVFVGITGSNGKTTTTLLTHHMLKKGGLNVGLAGNIGKSFAQQVAEQDFDFYALEISSFQLDGIEKFAPHIAVITNISPDHLDRYNYQYENYIASKFRITSNQNENDFLIYDADDVAINNWLQKNKTKAQLLPFFNI
jgi:UDP-N-acetylmuramoylalanine--D-glutamate ligase